MERANTFDPTLPTGIGLGHSSALPGHAPGEDHTWGAGQRDDEEECTYAFCVARRRKPADPLEAGKAAALDLAVEKHLREGTSEESLRHHINALNDMEVR